MFMGLSQKGSQVGYYGQMYCSQIFKNELYLLVLNKLCKLVVANDTIKLVTVVEVPNLSIDNSEFKLAACGSHLLVSDGKKTYELVNNQLKDLDFKSDNLFPFNDHVIVSDSNHFLLYNRDLKMERVLFKIADAKAPLCAEGGLFVIEYRLQQNDTLDGLYIVDATDGFQVYKAEKTSDHDYVFQNNYMYLFEYLPNGHRCFKAANVNMYMFDDAEFG